MTNNNSYIEKILFSAIEKEKEYAFNNNRVHLIMKGINELSIKTLYEAQRFTPKLVIQYCVSIAASVFLGCIIGNLFDICSTNSILAACTEIEQLSIGFGGFILPI